MFDTPVSLKLEIWFAITHQLRKKKKCVVYNYIFYTILFLKTLKIGYIIL